MKTLRIGNGAGFWGDQLDAPWQLARWGDLDYLTLEYLAELTLSILAHQRARAPELGYVTDLPRVVGQLLPEWQQGARFRLVTNGGGMNPAGCAVAVSETLAQAGLGEVRVAAVTGDDLMDRIDLLATGGESFAHFEDGRELGELLHRVVSANAYLGAEGIVGALRQDAQIVLTGRVADASLVVGPAVFEFGWAPSAWDLLAMATVAGHLIECGAQVTGGMYSDWSPELLLGRVGYPIAELHMDGSCVITKPSGTQGCVSVGTVSEQLVYEIEDPRQYFTPDVTADFSSVRLQEVAAEGVRVEGARGTPPPARFKVSMAYRDGYAVSGSIVVAGPRAEAAAEGCIRTLRARLQAADCRLDQLLFEKLGAGDALPGLPLWQPSGGAAAREIVLRVSGRAATVEPVERLARELAPLVTSGPPGVTGYTTARSRPRPVLSYWPTTIARQLVEPHVVVRSASDWLQAAPQTTGRREPF